MVVGPEAQQLRVTGLFQDMRLSVFLARLCVDGGLFRGDERKLEHLGGGEAPRRVAGQGPDDIDDAVGRLIVKLRRLSAELHGRKDVDLERALALLLQGFCPWSQQPLVDVGRRRQEVVQLQRNCALGARGTRSQDERRRKHGTTGFNKAPSVQYHRSLPLIRVAPPGNRACLCRSTSIQMTAIRL
ncbi:hypothetical protein D9M70_567550 [compost metagenome]